MCVNVNATRVIRFFDTVTFWRAGEYSAPMTEPVDVSKVNLTQYPCFKHALAQARNDFLLAHHCNLMSVFVSFVRHICRQQKSSCTLATCFTYHRTGGIRLLHAAEVSTPWVQQSCVPAGPVLQSDQYKIPFYRRSSSQALL